MAMPHDVFKKKCIKKLKGLSGKKREEKINELIKDLPGYKDGPYANVRKWLSSQKEKAIISKNNFSHEKWEVKKQGDATFAFIGFPSVGKSSLICELTNATVKTASYEFTTKKPFSATIKIDNALIQLIDLPGIIVGASSGKGFGKRVLSNAKIATKIILVVEMINLKQINIIIKELEKFGFKLNKENTCIIFTKKDLAIKNNSFDEIKNKIDKEALFPSLCVSIFEKNDIDVLKSFLFKESNLIRVKPFDSNEFVVLKKNALVKDYCEKIHKDLSKRFKFAFVKNFNSSFPRKKVGLKSLLNDKDEIELVLLH